MKPLNDKQKEMFFKVACSLVLCASLMCVMWMTGRVLSAENPWDTNAKWLLGASLLCLGGYEVLYFFYKKKTADSKLNVAHIAYCAYCAVLGVMTFAAGENPVMFCVICGIYFLFPIAKRVVSIIKNHKVRNIVFNILCIGVFTAVLALTVQHDEENAAFSYMIGGMLTGTVISVTCLAYILGLALSHINYIALKKVIRKTYAGEILFGLLLIVIAFSMVLMVAEESIVTYDDALWYCFMLVTTIGFGDLTAVTIIGRVLSVILGIYGIVVVAIVTSVIVNFYSEVRNDKGDVEDEDDRAELVEAKQETKTAEKQPTEPRQEAIEEQPFEQQE